MKEILYSLRESELRSAGFEGLWHEKEQSFAALVVAPVVALDRDLLAKHLQLSAVAEAAGNWCSVNGGGICETAGCFLCNQTGSHREDIWLLRPCMFSTADC